MEIVYNTPPLSINGGGTLNILPISYQISGDHYKTYPIQPIEYITANRLNFIEGNIVKLITRYKDKGGETDIDKLIHYAQLLKHFEYGGNKRNGSVG